MVDPSAIPRNRTRKECADYLSHFSFLNTVETTVTNAELRTDRGYKGSGPRLSTFDVSTSTYEITNFRISPCPNLHLVMTFCRQLPSSGHPGMRFQSFMSLSQKTSAWPSKCFYQMRYGNL